MRISDWSSDVCSSDLAAGDVQEAVIVDATAIAGAQPAVIGERFARFLRLAEIAAHDRRMLELDFAVGIEAKPRTGQRRSEEHTSELQSLMRISYAVFCLKEKKQ